MQSVQHTACNKWQCCMHLKVCMQGADTCRLLVKLWHRHTQPTKPCISGVSAFSYACQLIAMQLCTNIILDVDVKSLVLCKDAALRQLTTACTGEGHAMQTCSNAYKSSLTCVLWTHEAACSVPGIVAPLGLSLGTAR